MVGTTMVIEIGACTTWRTKTLRRQLETAARRCNVARTAMLRTWERWHEDHPGWPGEVRKDKEGNVVLRKDGTPAVKKTCGPKELLKTLYHEGRRAAPEVYSQVISHCAQHVVARLQTKTPYHHPGPEQWQWQAVLAHNGANRPSYLSKLFIPVPNQAAVLCYCGDLSQDASSGIAAEVRAHGCSCAVLRFPLLAKQPGPALRQPIVRLEVRQLSGGHRALLRRIARRELKMADSQITFQRGAWRFNLCFDVPARNLGLDADRVAVLTPTPPGAYRPFELVTPEDRIELGDGLVLARRYERWKARDRELRAGSRRGHGKGHGRGRLYRTLKTDSRAVRDMQELFAKHLAADVVKHCARHNCGTLVYREPSLGLRPQLWLEKHGAPCDWTHLAAQINHACLRNGIAVPPRLGRMKTKDHRAEYEALWKKTRRRQKTA